MKPLVFAALALFSCQATSSAPAPAPAQAADLLADAQTRAASEHKRVFLTFGAPWCGWCIKLHQFAPHCSNTRRWLADARSSAAAIAAFASATAL